MAPSSFWVWVLALVPVALVWGSHDVTALLQHEATLAQAPPLTWESGKEAEVAVETGSMANTWIPCTIEKQKSTGFVEVRVNLGTCIGCETTFTVSESLLRKIELDNMEKFKEAQTRLMYDPAEALKVITELNRDADRRMRTRMYLNGNTTEEVRAFFAKKAMADRKRKEAKIRARGCPQGYQELDTVAKGPDTLGLSQRQPTVELCAAACDVQPGCMSFEWSIGGQVCSFNKVAKPDKRRHAADLMICGRPSGGQSQAAQAASEQPSVAKE
uniref:Apple domain-containing protein n=1 Tax=Alexandrium monilatum TaxID=311494 RepID=A0A7S4QIL2_9DINO